MKTKLVIALITAVFSLQLLNSQTSYMPVFGDTTRYYWSMQGIDGSSFLYFDYIKKNDSIIIPDYVIYDSLLVNRTNSKIWAFKSDGLSKPLGRFLVMDLDLLVGEKYTDQLGTTHTVDSVYIKNNRKHIRFEKKHNVSILLLTPSGGVAVDSLCFEFIEGVGNNICFAEGTDLHESTTWLRSQYTNKVLTYGAPEWFPCWDEYIGFTDVKKTTMENKMRLSPSPATNKLNVEIPTSFNLKNVLLNIYDINGKQQYLVSPTKHKIIVDVSKFDPGIYMLQLTSNNYNETIKFIKS